MGERTYTAEDFRRVSDEMTRLGVGNGTVYAALNIAARVMTPGVIVQALRVHILGPENAAGETGPPLDWEQRAEDLVRTALTQGGGNGG